MNSLRCDRTNDPRESICEEVPHPGSYKYELEVYPNRHNGRPYLTDADYIATGSETISVNEGYKFEIVRSGKQASLARVE
jgi:hypothetical protein